MSDEENPEILELKKELKKYIIRPSDYKMIRPIGKGGYAEVYLAKNKKTGKNVAYKQLFTALQPKQLTHFAREVSTMASVNHPFLLKFYGFSPNYPLALVSEYIPNGSLFSYIHSENRSKKLTGSHRSIISMGIAHAMIELHKLGIIHRDLKSLNVLLDKKFLPRLGDFGIARYLSDDEPMTMRLGTPHWMAPETLKGNTNYGPEVDVYSFGMLLYELLTNSIPWEGKDPLSVANAVVHKVRPELPDDAPEALHDLIERCWSQKPSERPTFTEIYEMFKNREVEFKGTEDDAIEWLEEIINEFERKKNRKNKKNKNKRESDSDDYSDSDTDYDSDERTKKKLKKFNEEEEEQNKKPKKTKSSRNTISDDDDFNTTEIMKLIKKDSDEKMKKKNAKNENDSPKQKKREKSDSDSENERIRKRKGKKEDNEETDYENDRIPMRRSKTENTSNITKRSSFDTDDIYDKNKNKNINRNHSESIQKSKRKQNTSDNIYQGNKYDKNEFDDTDSDSNNNYIQNKTIPNRNRKNIPQPTSKQAENEIDTNQRRSKRPRYSDISRSLRGTSSQNTNLSSLDYLKKNSPSAQSEINLIYNEENENNSQSINQQFRPIISSNTPIAKKASILRHMAHKIMNDNLYAESFINNDFHHRLPLDSYNSNNDAKSIQSKQLIDACFDVVLALFTTVPEMLQTNFEETMKTLIKISPIKSITILANFSSHISQLDNPWPLLDLMLNESSYFLQNKCGNMLVMTLYYLCMNNKKFKESRLADCVVAFLDGIRSTNVKTIKSSYNALCVFYDGDDEVDFESISKHIKDEEIRDNALNFLLRLEKIPVIDDLIQSLLEEAKMNDKACLCLIKMAQSIDGAMAIIETDTKWISEPIPTIEKTMQLFLSIIKHSEIARYIMSSGKSNESGLFNNSSPLNFSSGSLSVGKNHNVSYSGRFDGTNSSELKMSMKLNSDVYHYIMQLYLLVCSSHDSDLLRAATASIEAFSATYHYNYNYSSNFNHRGINNAITLEFLSQMQKSKALLKMLKLSLQLNNDTSIKAGLIIIDILSDVDYAKEYVIFADKIAELINENSDKSVFAIHLAAKLSKFDLCAKEFNDLDLRDYFVELLKDKEYREEAERFIKNIDKYTQYY